MLSQFVLNLRVIASKLSCVIRKPAFNTYTKQRRRSAVLLHRLISAFFFSLPKKMNLLVYIQIFKALPIFCSCIQPGLCLTWLEPTTTDLLLTRLYFGCPKIGLVLRKPVFGVSDQV